MTSFEIEINANDNEVLRNANRIYTELLKGVELGEIDPEDEIGWCKSKDLSQFHLIYEFDKLTDAGLLEKLGEEDLWRITLVGQGMLAALDKPIISLHEVASISLNPSQNRLCFMIKKANEGDDHDG